MVLKSDNIMKNILRIVTVAVLMLSAVAVSAQRPKLVKQNPHDRYEVRSGKVYYGNIVLPEADPYTINDLGFGYAKDSRNVWWEGKLLPHVDARSFRLNVNGHGDRPHHGSGHGPGNAPGHAHGPGPEKGYEIMGRSVLYNGRIVKGARADSFKDLGWGYAVDTFDVYYCGEEIDASTMNFTVLADGYAKNSFDVFYCGQEVEGASANSFKVLRDGYAEDAVDTYYRGVEIDD